MMITDAPAVVKPTAVLNLDAFTLDRTFGRVAKLAADAWSMGYAIASMAKLAAIEDGDDKAFYSLDRENRDDFFSLLISLGCPVATWEARLALCRSGFPVSFAEPAGPRPTALESYTPTAADLADYAEYLADRDARYWAEWVVAMDARADAMELAFGPPWDHVSDAELVESGNRHPALGYDIYSAAGRPRVCLGGLRSIGDSIHPSSKEPRSCRPRPSPFPRPRFAA